MMRAKDSILDELVEEIEDKKRLSYWTGSFWDFEDVLKREKSKAVRTSVQHLTDAIKYFGSAKGEISGEVIPIYNVWQDRIESIVPDRERIFGMDRTLHKLVSYFETLAREEGKERIIILRGPPATAKSSLINLMMKALEFYSLSEEGRKYAFEWVFPKIINSESMGYAISAGSIEEMNSGSYAYMSDENIEAIIGCKMRDHPLLLLPKSQRIDYIERISRQTGTEIKLPYKLEEKQLCKNCQGIIDSLFEKNKGDLSKVLRHIRVKSYSLSHSSQRGMATVISAQNPEG